MQGGNGTDDFGGAPTAAPSQQRLVAITLDPASIGRSNANIEQEREVAIYDLLEDNSFSVDGRQDGPYRLMLGMSEDRLVLTIAADAAPDDAYALMLSMTAFRRVIKDYFIVCDSYYQAIRSAPASRIQSIDMGRRALHDEGSQLLIERLTGKVTLDHITARRLFTLICALHWKG
jgi:uncharacterized protein (UPF0262 family)